MDERTPSGPGHRDRLPLWLPPNYEPGRETPADLGDRSGPYFIDFAIFAGLTFGTFQLIDAAGGHPALAAPLWVAIFLCYSPLSTARWGGTPGKRMCSGLRVAHLRDGSSLSYGEALRRHLAHWGLHVVGPIHHVSILWDEPLQQCLHDKFVESVVVVRE